MRKFIIAVTSFIMVGCANPSMERGFDSLTESMSDLVQSFDNLNIDQMTNDMESIIFGIEDIANNLDDYLEAITEYNATITLYNEALAEYGDAMTAFNEANAAAATAALASTLADLEALAESGNEWAGIFLQVARIQMSLDEVLAQVQTLATKEQVQALLADVQEMAEGVDQLVALADYDYDGVPNALDKCPDTPITEINNVNADGCSPSQITD